MLVSKLGCLLFLIYSDFNYWSFIIYDLLLSYKGLPCSSDSEESTCNVGDLGLIPELGRSPGERNGNPLQYSCIENPTDRGAWWTTVHGVVKSQTWLKEMVKDREAWCAAIHGLQRVRHNWATEILSYRSSLVFLDTNSLQIYDMHMFSASPWAILSLSW